MYRFELSAVVALFAATAFSSGLDAQVARAPQPAARACTASLAMITLKVLRADGAPEPSVVVSLRRVRDGVVVLAKAPMVERGIYELARDGGDVMELSEDSPGEPRRRAGVHLTTTPEKFIAEVRRGRRSVRVPQTLGLDRHGCHVVRLAGESVVTLR